MKVAEIELVQKYFNIKHLNEIKNILWFVKQFISQIYYGQCLMMSKSITTSTVAWDFTTVI